MRGHIEAAVRDNFPPTFEEEEGFEIKRVLSAAAVINNTINKEAGKFFNFVILFA